MDDVDEPGEIARRVARASLRSPDVVELSAGSFGTLSTPVPGGRVRGVAVRSDTVEVGVVVHFGRPLPEIAGELRKALAPLAGGRAVHICVEDVVAGAAVTRTRPQTR
ncbi:hypothetical protein [Nocardiopsis sp. CC223A]|uniref:hypothetical protein n=1 Tax=Nocardiopsis sp. CC223A TaxID=3044051 RepID=UPI00278C5C8C|nr:hypothetical protein [Nocardiopsis sp. CC223A]